MTRIYKTAGHSERGFSLIELLVALAILAIALTPLLSIFLHALKASEKANKNAIMTSLARDMAEEIRSFPFWDPNYAYDENLVIQYYPRAPKTATYPEGQPQPFGLETGDGESYDGTAGVGRLGSFDDVDDYNGWCRGENCTNCSDYPTGICQDDTPLESYDGRKYDGLEYNSEKALPELKNYTRRVEVFNIFPHITSEFPVPEHQIDVDSAYNTSWQDKQFLYYNYNDDIYPNLTSRNEGGTALSAKGITRLKIVKVTVEYNGPVVPPMGVEELNLVAAPLSE